MHFKSIESLKSLNLVEADMLEGLEVVLHALTQAAGVYAEDRCQLEAADSDTALVMTGGGLMTAIALQGLRQQWDAPLSSAWWKPSPWR